MKRQVILLTTHIINERVLQLYEKLKLAKGANNDIFLLIHHEEELHGELNISENISYSSFSIESLSELGYYSIEETIIPGSNHFPVFQFYKEHPIYDYYWNIEYDVDFSGKWEYFFNLCDSLNADFLTSHIRGYEEEPLWWMWDSMEINTMNIIKEKYIRSFNPIYRISFEALDFLDKFLQNENCGHHEVLLPTILHHSGFKIIDFGGNGKFVLSGFENKLYIDEAPNPYGELCIATMRFRPSYSTVGEKENKLYHPIK